MKGRPTLVTVDQQEHAVVYRRSRVYLYTHLNQLRGWTFARPEWSAQRHADHIAAGGR